MAYSVRRALGTSEMGKHPMPKGETPLGFFAELCLEHLHPKELRPVLMWFQALKPEHQRFFTTDAVLALGVAFAYAEGLRKPGTVLQAPPSLGDHICGLFKGRLLFAELNTRETVVSVLYKPPAAAEKVHSPPIDTKPKTQYGTTLERTVTRLSSTGSDGAVSVSEPGLVTPRGVECGLAEDERRPILRSS